jgi:hypothetical protein
MSFESYYSFEPARPEDYDYLATLTKSWLFIRGVHQEGSEPLKRYPDGALVYSVDDNGRYGEIEGIEYIAEQEELGRVTDKRALHSLQVGNKISFAYTPSYYLKSSDEVYTPNPEAIHIEITPPSTTVLRLIQFIFTREDIDSPNFTGYRLAVPIPNIANALGYAASSEVARVRESTRKPSEEECKDLVSIVRSLEY